MYPQHGYICCEAHLPGLLGTKLPFWAIESHSSVARQVAIDGLQLPKQLKGREMVPSEGPRAMQRCITGCTVNVIEPLQLHRCSCHHVTSCLRLLNHKHAYITYFLRHAAILDILTLCNYAGTAHHNTQSKAESWLPAVLHGIALPNHRNPSDMHAWNVLSIQFRMGHPP